MKAWKTIETLSYTNDKAVIDDTVNDFVKGEHEMAQIIMDVLYSIDPKLAESVVDAFACLSGPFVEDLDGIKHEMYLHELFDNALWHAKNSVQEK